MGPPILIDGHAKQGEDNYLATPPVSQLNEQTIGHFQRPFIRWHQLVRMLQLSQGSLPVFIFDLDQSQFKAYLHRFHGIVAFDGSLIAFQEISRFTGLLLLKMIEAEGLEQGGVGGIDFKYLVKVLQPAFFVEQLLQSNLTGFEKDVLGLVPGQGLRQIFQMLRQFPIGAPLFPDF